MNAPMPQATLYLLSRNPIFTAEKNVWGYEIQAASSPTNAAGPEAASGNVSAAVIAGDYVGLNAILARNQRMLLTYTWEQILNETPYAFPAKTSAILLNSECQQDTSLEPILTRFEADGHLIALEWFPAITLTSPTEPLAKIICLNSPEDTDHPEFQEILDSGAMCLVRNITTQEEFSKLHAKGVALFQGCFFKKAEIIPGKKLSSHQNSRLRLMRLVEEESPDLDTLANTIQADVTLSYRLLTYLNSPTFGFTRKIDSIRQAMTLLGWSNIRNWLRAVLLTNLSQSEQQMEVLHLSLCRARFLEQLVKQYDYWNFKPDEMFLLGMFSLLDAMLGIPMQDALDFLPLSENLKKALCGDSASEYNPLFCVVNALEELPRSEGDAAIRGLSLDTEKTRAIFYEATAWAASMLETSK